MKVILLKNVKGLGKKGDMVNAKEGYVRNFLLPKGLCLEATKGNMKTLNEKKNAEELKKKEEYDKAIKLKEKMDNISIEIKSKAGENGKLFGSITSKDIANILKKQYNIKVDKRKIMLSDNIKSLGTTIVEIKIYPEVISQLKVKVVED